jgi:hypothetical protein
MPESPLALSGYTPYGVRSISNVISTSLISHRTVVKDAAMKKDLRSRRASFSEVVPEFVM